MYNTNDVNKIQREILLTTNANTIHRTFLTIHMKIYTCTIEYTQSNITLFRVRTFKKVISNFVKNYAYNIFIVKILYKWFRTQVLIS